MTDIGNNNNNPENNNGDRISETDEQRIERRVAEELEIRRRVAAVEMQEEQQISRGKLADIHHHQQKIVVEKRVSVAWYLLPILFGFLGGLFMFWATKDADRGRAVGGFKLGIVLSVLGFILFIMVLGAT